MAMTPEYKTKWLEALRSGRYPQGREQLMTRKGKYCCLGVLAQIDGQLKIAVNTQYDQWGITDVTPGEGHLSVEATENVEAHNEGYTLTVRCWRSTGSLTRSKASL